MQHSTGAPGAIFMYSATGMSAMALGGSVEWCVGSLADAWVLLPWWLDGRGMACAPSSLSLCATLTISSSIGIEKGAPAAASLDLSGWSSKIATTSAILQERTRFFMLEPKPKAVRPASGPVRTCSTRGIVSFHLKPTRSLLRSASSWRSTSLSVDLSSITCIANGFAYSSS